MFSLLVAIQNQLDYRLIPAVCIQSSLYYNWDMFTKSSYSDLLKNFVINII